MTLTLAMTVEREAAIVAFRPEPFYTVLLQMEDCMASSERFKDKTQAEELLAEYRKSSRALVQKTERKEKSERPPALYDLTTLQSDANRQLGYSAQQTIVVALRTGLGVSGSVIPLERHSSVSLGSKSQGMNM